jgi:ribosomal protein S27AE
MTNISVVEKAKNGNSHCSKCGRIIFKDTTRVVLSGDYNGHPTKKYLCPKCGLEVVEDELVFLTKIQGQLRGSFVDDMQINLVKI